MAMSLSEFREFFIKQEILPDAASSSRHPEEVFLEEALEVFRDPYGMSADITPLYDATSIGNRRFKKMRVDGASLDLESNSLHLLLCDFNAGAVETLTREALSTKVQQVIAFFENVLKGYYVNGEMTNPVVALASDIVNNLDSLYKIHFYIASTNLLGNNVKTLELGEQEIDGHKFEYALDVLDIGKIYRAKLGAGPDEEIEIKCADYGIKGIPCIKADVGTDQYESYLAIVPGRFLSDIYKKYNGSILESNVRSFLKFNGGVNKGIRDTIKSQPSRFFTYNNGISTTAKAVRTDVDRKLGLILKSFIGLQIINGGQTTATLAATSIKDKVPLDNIFVQMKLTVIKTADSDLVRNIARFSNKQNAVKDADLNSSHPFYIKMKEYSDKTFAPVSGLVQPIWFFERARGEYDQPMMQMTKAQIAKYKQLRPKSMLYKVVDIAKYMLTSMKHPYLAAWGGEVCGRKFQGILEKMWIANPDQFDQMFYKELIARKILFEHIGRQISEQSWYKENGAYRPQLIEYTFAKLVLEAEKVGLGINYIRIWDKQSVQDDFNEDIRKIAYLAYECLYDPNRTKSNIETYSKTEECWKRMEKKTYVLSATLRKLLISKADKEVQAKTLTNVEIPRFCETEMDIFKMGVAYWKRLAAVDDLSESDRDVLVLATDFAAFKVLSLSKRQISEICQVQKKLLENERRPNE